ncbi:hypothetical protein JD516_09480 [Aeromonas jandaei]|uniref:hypothetical protein n=1 Tax=Aeromonas jandaei TaxID=650 RepID=UPI00191CCEF8|nr:hypothetical protein [Aeromonas jandaei]MBL0598041.1 hypothetical protein [Aeromonas jandaei]
MPNKNNKNGEWWNGGWQRWSKGSWDGEKESNFRKNDHGSVTPIEKSEGVWVNGEPCLAKKDNTVNLPPIIQNKSTVVSKPNNKQEGESASSLPTIDSKIKKSATNVNKRKVNTTTHSLPKIGGGHKKDAIVKNFRCGDLMYGTSSGRDVNYLKKLEDYHQLNPVNSTAGQNNGNEWARKNVRNTRSMIINSYNDPVRAALSDEFHRLENKGGGFMTSKLPKAIEQAKIGRPAKYGFDFDAYQDIASNHEKLKVTSKHVKDKLWWKRGSKSGLEMVAQQSSDSTRRIHFILDGMNIHGVVSKDSNLFGRSITASELRYIYRHWNRLQGKVIFYNDGKVVSPPWEDGESAHIWNNYHPKNKIV